MWLLPACLQAAPLARACPDRCATTSPSSPAFKQRTYATAYVAFYVCLQDGQELVFTYHHVLESEAFIVQAVREQGPFDGICGFSQVSTAAASILAALTISCNLFILLCY